MNVEKKTNEEMKISKRALEAFAVVNAGSVSELCTEKLVPIHEEYDKRNLFGEEKTFRMVPRKFAAFLLRFEGTSMFPEEYFNESEKRALNDFVKKSYVKSAKVGGKRVYFGLNSKIRRYLISVLKTRD